MYINPYHLIKNNNIYNYINNKTITNKKIHVNTILIYINIVY